MSRRDDTVPCFLSKQQRQVLGQLGAALADVHGRDLDRVTRDGGWLAVDAYTNEDGQRRYLLAKVDATSEVAEARAHAAACQVNTEAATRQRNELAATVERMAGEAEGRRGEIAGLLEENASIRAERDNTLLALSTSARSVALLQAAAAKHADELKAARKRPVRRRKRAKRKVAEVVVAESRPRLRGRTSSRKGRA